MFSQSVLFCPKSHIQIWFEGVNVRRFGDFRGVKLFFDIQIK